LEVGSWRLEIERLRVEEVYEVYRVYGDISLVTTSFNLF
jgi:hypothetical protein